MALPELNGVGGGGAGSAHPLPLHGQDVLGREYGLRIGNQKLRAIAGPAQLRWLVVRVIHAPSHTKAGTLLNQPRDQAHTP